MILLGIETATIEVGVGLAKDVKPLASMVARPGRRHVETLHPSLEAVLRAASLELADIDLVAVDVGPGLFTGLRVGIAAAKGLALALSLPLLALRSTQVLLAGVPNETSTTIAVIDMRRGDVAWEVATDNAAEHGNDSLDSGAQRVSLGSPEELVAQLSELDGPLFLVGDGAVRYADRISAGHGGLGKRVRIGGERFAAPSVTALLELASHYENDSDAYVNAYAITPLYLRQPDAKANFSTRASNNGDETLAGAVSTIDRVGG